jgi:hypothetical protein
VSLIFFGWSRKQVLDHLQEFLEKYLPKYFFGGLQKLLRVLFDSYSNSSPNFELKQI